MALHIGLIAVFLNIFIAVTNADQREKVIDFHRGCLDAHGVEEDVLVEMLEGRVREDEDFYLHFFCAAKKANMMTEDGTVNTANFEIDMKDVIDPGNMDNVASIIRKCLIQKEDILTTMRESVHCFANSDHGL